jgi:hypothetical protein
MKTITYSLILGTFFLLSSCAFNINYPDKIKGEGQVITEQIMLEDFNELQLERGWTITLEPSSSNYMVVEANENLFEVFEYENLAGRLKVSSSKQISSAGAKQITIYFTEKLALLKASSGTEVNSPEVLTFDNFVLDISSGAEVDLDLELESLDLETSSGSEARLIANADDVSVDSSSGSSAEVKLTAIATVAEASSGSDIEIEGSTKEFEARSSSGASINSKGFESEKVNAKASSGSSISVYPIEDLTATTSSGGDVYYYNEPKGRLDLNRSKSGGSIKLK